VRTTKINLFFRQVAEQAADHPSILGVQRSDYLINLFIFTLYRGIFK